MITPDFDPSLSLTVTRNGREVYTVQGIPQYGANELAVALTQYPVLRERLAEIEKHAANLVATARNHFPKSIHNPDKFELELFSALLNNKATS